jgi:hypothetical protein
VRAAAAWETSSSWETLGGRRRLGLGLDGDDQPDRLAGDLGQALTQQLAAGTLEPVTSEAVRARDDERPVGEPDRVGRLEPAALHRRVDPREDPGETRTPQPIRVGHRRVLHVALLRTRWVRPFGRQRASLDSSRRQDTGPSTGDRGTDVADDDRGSDDLMVNGPRRGAGRRGGEGVLRDRPHRSDDGRANLTPSRCGPQPFRSNSPPVSRSTAQVSDLDGLAGDSLGAVPFRPHGNPGHRRTPGTARPLLTAPPSPSASVRRPSRARRVSKRARRPSEEVRDEAHLPAEQPPPFAQARLPLPHAHTCRTRDRQEPSPPGSRQAHRVTDAPSTPAPVGTARPGRLARSVDVQRVLRRGRSSAGDLFALHRLERPVDEPGPDGVPAAGTRLTVVASRASGTRYAQPGEAAAARGRTAAELARRPRRRPRRPFRQRGQRRPPCRRRARAGSVDGSTS